MSKSRHGTTTTTNKPTTVLIRAAQESDAARIAELGACVFSATFGHSVSADELQCFLEKEYTPVAIGATLSDVRKDTLLAIDPTRADGDDTLLGFAVLARGSSEPCVDGLADKVELQRLYVRLDAHGTGVGGRLVRAAERLASEQGSKNVWLGVWEENCVAIKAYEKWGFQTVGRHDFVIGTVVQTDLIMTKAL